MANDNILKVEYKDKKVELKFLLDSNKKVSNMAKIMGKVSPGVYDQSIDGTLSFTPHNGPTFIENYPLPGHPEYIVKKIHFVEKNDCYVIELKDNDIFYNQSKESMD